VLNSNAGPAEFTLVLSDDEFNSIQQKAPDEALYTFYGFTSKNWKSSETAISSLKTTFSTLGNDHVFVSNTINAYLVTMKGLSVTLFVGFFVSLLFFLASGSVIYFKLFNQLSDDRRQFRSLRRTGLLKKEANKILTIEFSLLFFIPFAVAVLHSSIAMVDFAHLMAASGEIWISFAKIVGLLLLCFFLFFLSARIRYVRQVWNQR
jgi:putative ABC transport system permease protein